MKQDYAGVIVPPTYICAECKEQIEGHRLFVGACDRLFHLRWESGCRPVACGPVESVQEQPGELTNGN